MLLLCGLTGWAGTTLLLTQLRWFRRPALAVRLRPYLTGAASDRTTRSGWSVEAFRAVLGPLARAAGNRLSGLFGVSEELAVRLERVHSPLDVTDFRLRQLGWVIAALTTGLLGTAVVRPPAPVSLLAIVGLPLLAFLVVEQGLARRSTRWQQRLFLELPVVSEQLGMLMSAGYSLGASLARLSRRTDGAVAQDLRRVVGRTRQGIDESRALAEWASLAAVPAVDRLVAVLGLNREAGDLGHLITEEARSVRAEVHRELIETIERNGQQVWIPVTVATLVPGVLFLAVPFIEAMRLFTSG
ncbi:MAG TPA: type II secretion system F family protein [Acidimicrobiales bacterium]